MLNKLVYLLIAISIFFLNSCTQKVVRHPVYIDTALKNYFNYDAGSYWVYYDSISNTEDSVYVTVNNDSAPYWDNVTAEEYRFINFTSRKDSKDWHMNIVPNYSKLSISDQSHFIEDQITEQWPFYTGTLAYTGNTPHTTYECSYYPEFIVFGVSYKDVYKIRWYLDDAYDEYLLCNNGFIKVQLNRDIKKNYFLLRYKIIKK